jgi:hypothetical protein
MQRLQNKLQRTIGNFTWRISAVRELNVAVKQTNIQVTR